MAALAWLERRPLQPATRELTPAELGVLRCHGLDEELTVSVLGQAMVLEQVSTPGARARCLRSFLPDGASIYGASALWVHTGLRPPEVLEAIRPVHTGRAARLRMCQGRLPASDVMLVGGLSCCTLARAAVDVARLDTAARAVEALLAAQHAGIKPQELYNCVSHCVGAQVRGRDRVERLIRELYGEPALRRYLGTGRRKPDRTATQKE
ncbi:Uncharacterised protein [Actinomyces bovis]|uniref:AbiEi antitoxin C-terminal domain-containing protein n=2 Tax=Actinomyces bovis TaxID=1658 RepID=A0ABY1VQQ2_9ACTO|nr:Uncharacterised protein [Actinomyces bovis]VEG53714.1 Uncharacterised protein [Actinomyces israelii]